eukprot:5705924-Prymnesium_polylepis.3
MLRHLSARQGAQVTPDDASGAVTVVADKAGATHGAAVAVEIAVAQGHPRAAVLRDDLHVFLSAPPTLPCEQTVKHDQKFGLHVLGEHVLVWELLRGEFAWFRVSSWPRLHAT